MGVTTKAGTRLRSLACSTEVVVVRGSDVPIDLRCGGHAMAEITGTNDVTSGLAVGFDAGTLVGKRYVDIDDSIELLCTKPGAGSLSLGEALLEIKSAKPLPSSD
jgi:hypothetical protein